ncbi:MAG: CobD/CbiB family cobalamin biosynthesis protein [Haloglomus sp.]
MSRRVATAVLVAALLDRVVAEPPDPHPVALFGRVVAPLDRAWSRPRAAGAVIAGLLPALAAGAVGAVVAVVERRDRRLGVIAAALAVFTTTSHRLLVETAADVVTTSERDLDAAREDLLALAGRDAADLSAGEVRSAAVESAAENLADGLVAPLAGFCLGAVVSLPAAAAGAAWVKAVNTLDSMLGYPDRPHGTASARLDDAVAWLPARASAGLLALAAGDGGALTRARAWLTDVPSPNSGWPMGALAAALGTRLEKPGVYALPGGSSLPDVAVARRGLRLVARAGWLAWGGAAALAWAGGGDGERDAPSGGDS